MKNWLVTRSNIPAAPLPDKTESYSPIPHSVFLDEIQERLAVKDMSIASERFLTADNYKILTGNFTLSKKGETYTELAPTIYFVNSYNKTRKATIRAGATVLVCRNGMLGTVVNGYYSRKHSGTALEDFRKHIDLIIDGLEAEFNRLTINMNEMKAINLSDYQRAQLVGDMIINEDMISPTQISLLKKEIKYSEHFKDKTSLWSFYNNCTEAFKQNHPLTFDRQHIKLHTYISDKFALTGYRGLYGKPLVEATQDDIIDLDPEELALAD